VACSSGELEAIREALVATGLPDWDAALELITVDPEGAKPLLWNELKAAPEYAAIRYLCNELAARDPGTADWAFGAWLAMRAMAPNPDGWRSWVGLAPDPAGLRELTLIDVPWLRSLPGGLAIHGHVTVHACLGFQNLPGALRVDGFLNMEGCPRLMKLPEGLDLRDSLYLTNCENLTSLPSDLKVRESLYLHGCPSLVGLPAGLVVPGRLRLSFYAKGDERGLGVPPARWADDPPARWADDFLPTGLKVGDLELVHCPLVRFPEGLRVKRSLSLKDCPVWDGRIPADAKVGGRVFTKLHPLGLPLSKWRWLHPDGERQS
jgi:hypothetical protein